MRRASGSSRCAAVAAFARSVARRRRGSTSSRASRSSAISCSNVGGDRVNVTTLVGPNGDVHVYTPAPSDAKTVADAKLLVINGLGLEGWLPRLVQSSGSKAHDRHAPATASRRCKLGSGRPIRMPGSRSPMRKSMSPISAMRWLRPIRRMPRSSAPMPTRYLAELDALDAEVRAAIAKIPPERRKVITTHNAFGYFAAAYGIAFIAPSGVSTETEPRARDIARHHPADQGRENPGGISGKYQRRPPDPPDRGRDRRQGRRHALFGQPDRRKGACPHLH